MNQKNVRDTRKKPEIRFLLKVQENYQATPLYGYREQGLLPA
jgi:hypothetical protein